MTDDAPTDEQRELAKDAITQLIQLVSEIEPRPGGRRRYASFCTSSETYKVLVAGGYKFWLTRHPNRASMWRISLGELRRALKFWG